MGIHRAIDRCGRYGVLVVSITFLAAPAPPPVTVQDRFNNNVINMSLWEVDRSGGMFVGEDDQRLEVRANGATGTVSHAGLSVRPWGIDWRYSANLSVDYYLNLNSPGGNRVAAIGFGFGVDGEFPDSYTGLTAGVQRESTGLYLVIGRYQDGETVGVQRVAISQQSGTINVNWSRSQDRLTVSAGGQSLSLIGLWAEFGSEHGQDPLVVSVGGVTFNGNVSFSGNRARLDDFVFTGVKRPR